MSDVMLFGVLRMPYEHAMSDERSRRQFYQRAQEAADRLAAACPVPGPLPRSDSEAAGDAIRAVFDERAWPTGPVACGRAGFEAARRIAALESQSAEQAPVQFTEQHELYVMGYGGNCRDCADADGVCPRSGLPCSMLARLKAVRHVFMAITYGVQNGFIPSPIAAPVREQRKAERLNIEQQKGR